MKIAILGYGTVGSGVYKILNETKHLTNFEVLKILDLPQNQDKLDIITTDFEQIIDDDSIECIIETMGGINPAYEYIKKALANKKHVISANKAVLALHLEEFASIAKENNVKILFEASCGGGVPWLASLAKAKRIDQIEYFYGILNGTSNYILDAMSNEGKDFNEVLKTAQQLGYAETDPSADIDGLDVKNKVVVSSTIAYNTMFNLEDIPTYTLRTVNAHDIAYFKGMDKTLKYFGEAKVNEQGYEAFVMVNAIDNTSVEANVKANYNAATLHGKTIGPLKFYGQGAGSLPTANAIIQDLIDIHNQTSLVDLTFDKQLTYQPLSKQNYIIRTTSTIDKEYLEKEDHYQKQTYYYTKAINANVLNDIVKNINDDNALIIKIAQF